jgi:hypothetical protein
VRRKELDRLAERHPHWTRGFSALLSSRSERAWSSGADDDDPEVERARLETQRALYELNRLRLYWGDDPNAYVNERSPLLAGWQERLEQPWQRWLARQLPEEALAFDDAEARLRAWAERDTRAVESADSRFVAEEMNRAGYRRLLEIFSLNALVEASQLSRALGGAASSVQSTLFRILMEEYGAGRLDKKHSSFFARMLEAEGMSTKPEAYLEGVPWQVLSAVNHAFYLAENKRYYLRFCGAFAYTELSTVVSFEPYARAAERLGRSNGRDDYWALHVREDERHGAWMLEHVALPLLKQFPAQQRELLFGYAQQRFVESLAGRAVVRACRAAAQQEVP